MFHVCSIVFQACSFAPGFIYPTLNILHLTRAQVAALRGLEMLPSAAHRLEAAVGVGMLQQMSLPAVARAHFFTYFIIDYVLC